MSLSPSSSLQLFLWDPQALPDQLEIRCNLSSISWIWNSLASLDGIFTRCLMHFSRLPSVYWSLCSSWTVQLLLNHRPPHPLTHSGAVQPAEKTRRGGSCLLSHSFSRYPKLVTTADGHNKGSRLRAFLCGCALAPSSSPTSISQSFLLSFLSKTLRHLNSGV